MALERQRFLTALPGGPYGASSDTWESLAARASQLANQHITARDVVDANAGFGTTPDQINAWLASIGGVPSSDGVNYILPAGFQVKLPAGVTVPAESDAGAVEAAASAPDASSGVDAAGVAVVGTMAVFAGLALLFGAGDRPHAGRSSHRRHGRIKVRRRRRR